MIKPNGKRVKGSRTPLRTYKPANADVTACVTYLDPDLGIVALSIRSTLGIMRASTAIHWDAGIFDRLVADGCKWLECYVKTIDTTYRAHVDTMREHGQLQQRFGLQRVLHLKYWTIVDGNQPQQTQQPEADRNEPVQSQLHLFGVTHE